MSVLLETSKGAITIDLYTDRCPLACTNFLKLCKIKYVGSVAPHCMLQATSRIAHTHLPPSTPFFCPDTTTMSCSTMLPMTLCRLETLQALVKEDSLCGGTLWAAMTWLFYWLTPSPPPEPLPCSHIHGDKKRFFADEIFPNLKHTKAGTVAFARAGGVEDTNGSQVRANPVLIHTSTVWLADTLSCLDSAVLLHSATQPRAP